MQLVPAGEPEVEQVRVASEPSLGVAVTVYAVIVAPFEAGAVHETESCASPADSVGAAGVPGVPTGTAAAEAVVEGPDPEPDAASELRPEVDSDVDPESAPTPDSAESR